MQEQQKKKKEKTQEKDHLKHKRKMRKEIIRFEEDNKEDNFDIDSFIGDQAVCSET